VARIGMVVAFVAGAWPATVGAQVAPPASETIALGDWQLSPVVEARVRGEYDRDLDDQDRGFLVERARLGLDAVRGAVEGRVVLQDARVWLLPAGVDPVRGRTPFASTGAHEVWAEAHTTSPRPMFVRLGRQAVTWGEGRLLGTADWSPTGRSLDALRARLPIGEGALEVLAASLSDSSGASLTAYGELFGARGEWAFHPLFALEGYLLARLAQENPPGRGDPSVRGQTYTGSLRLHGEADAWTWAVEGAYQLGHVADLAEDRSAWALAGHVARTFERVVLLPAIRLGIAHASGDDGGSTYRAFDPLLPDVHRWHGAMDLFSWSNEQEANARLSIVPWTDAAVSVEYRYARLAATSGNWRTAYLNELGSGPVPNNTEAELGHEIDGSLTWSPWVAVDLDIGYSALVVGNGARAILTAAQPGIATASVSHFGYVQTTLRVP
jgi:hypothetical protein